MQPTLNKLKAVSFLYVLIPVLLTACGGGSDSNSKIRANEKPPLSRPGVKTVSVNDEISKINQQVQKQGLDITPLTRNQFNQALLGIKKYMFPKKIRFEIEKIVKSGVMSDSFNFEILDLNDPTFLPRIDFNISGYTLGLIQGTREVYLENTPEKRAGCAKKKNHCEEPLFYPNFFETQSSLPTFDYSVGTKDLWFSHGQIQERPETKGFQQESLRVFINVDQYSITGITEYFGKGQNPETLKIHLQKALGKSNEVQIDLREILPPAPKKALYKFPGSQGHDVCYNAASTFFNTDHKKGDNSNELLEAIMNRFYCKKNKISESRFGDILYSGGHVVRYIMFDSINEKHIVYQMNSGGFESWRLLYLEDAFQGYSVAKGGSLVDNWMDIYSRCRWSPR